METEIDVPEKPLPTEGKTNNKSTTQSAIEFCGPCLNRLRSFARHGIVHITKVVIMEKYTGDGTWVNCMYPAMCTS